MGASEVLKIVLKVEFYCLKCKVEVLRAISKLIGIDKIEIDEGKSTVTVIGDVDPVAVVMQIRKVGMMAEIVTVGPPPKEEEKKEEVKKNKEEKNKEEKKEMPSELPICCKTCQHISIRVEEYGGCAIM